MKIKFLLVSLFFISIDIRAWPFGKSLTSISRSTSPTVPNSGVTPSKTNTSGANTPTNVSHLSRGNSYVAFGDALQANMTRKSATGNNPPAVKSNTQNTSSSNITKSKNPFVETNPFADGWVDPMSTTSVSSGVSLGQPPIKPLKPVKLSQLQSSLQTNNSGGLRVIETTGLPNKSVISTTTGTNITHSVPTAPSSRAGIFGIEPTPAVRRQDGSWHTSMSDALWYDPHRKQTVSQSNESGFDVQKVTDSMNVAASTSLVKTSFSQATLSWLTRLFSSNKANKSTVSPQKKSSQTVINETVNNNLGKLKNSQELLKNNWFSMEQTIRKDSSLLNASQRKVVEGELTDLRNQRDILLQGEQGYNSVPGLSLGSTPPLPPSKPAPSTPPPGFARPATWPQTFN